MRVAYTSGGYVTNIAIHDVGYTPGAGEYVANEYTIVGQVTKSDGTLIDTAQPSPHHYFDNTPGTDDWVVDPGDLSDYIEHRCDEVDAYYVDQLDLDFTYNTYDWQIDWNSQAEIHARALYAVQSAADSVTYPWTGDYQLWRDSSNTDRTFSTQADFMAFSKAISDRATALRRNCMDHKDAIRALGTFEAVEAYNITTGW